LLTILFAYLEEPEQRLVCIHLPCVQRIIRLA
jgi:hypothetical protein